MTVLIKKNQSCFRQAQRDHENHKRPNLQSSSWIFYGIKLDSNHNLSTNNFSEKILSKLYFSRQITLDSNTPEMLVALDTLSFRTWILAALDTKLEFILEQSLTESTSLQSSIDSNLTSARSTLNYNPNQMKHICARAPCWFHISWCLLQVASHLHDGLQKVFFLNKSSPKTIFLLRFSREAWARKLGSRELNSRRKKEKWNITKSVFVLPRHHYHLNMENMPSREL